MKKSLFNRRVTALALLLCAVTVAASATEVKKEYHREKATSDNTALTVINKFGSVVTETWDQNNIVIDVTVKVEHPSADRAQKLLEMITVEFTEQGDKLTAETVFSKDFSSFSWRGSHNSFSINYNIKMPAYIAIELKNKYGNTAIDEVSGQAKIETKYGDLSVHKLTRGNVKPLNVIVVAYGKASIDELSWAEINARYCGSFNIERATALLIDSKYSKIRIDEISSLVSDSKYDGYTVDAANNIVMTSGYTDIRFGEVTKKLEVETKYGNLTVDRIPAGFERVNVKSGYCAVKLGIDPSACYMLDAKCSYGSLKVDDSNFSPDRRITGNTSSELAGKVGKCNHTVAEVTVDASYGSVRLD